MGDLPACPCGGRRATVADISERDDPLALLKLPTEAPPPARARRLKFAFEFACVGNGSGRGRARAIVAKADVCREDELREVRAAFS